MAVALNKLAASTQGNDPCYKFYKNYSLASGLTYLSIVITTGVNYGLRVILLKLGRYSLLGLVSLVYTFVLSEARGSRISGQGARLHYVQGVHVQLREHGYHRACR